MTEYGQETICRGLPARASHDHDAEHRRSLQIRSSRQLHVCRCVSQSGRKSAANDHRQYLEFRGSQARYRRSCEKGRFQVQLRCGPARSSDAECMLFLLSLQMYEISTDHFQGSSIHREPYLYRYPLGPWLDFRPDRSGYYGLQLSIRIRKYQRDDDVGRI